MECSLLMRPLPQLMLALGFSCRLSTASRRSASLCLITLALSALCSLSSPCWASETPATSSSLQAAISSLSDQGGAFADLDGDSRPDLAIVRPEGWGPKGFQYRIELHLTSHPSSSCF